MKEVKFKRFSTKATAPKGATLWSAGHDLFSVEKVTIVSRRTAIALTDIGMKFDRTLVGKICSRSNLSARSIEVGAGVVDSGYRAIIYIVLHNLSSEEVTFNAVDKITQIILEKIYLPMLSEVFEFEDQTE